MTKPSRINLDQALGQALEVQAAPGSLREGLLAEARAQDRGVRRSPKWARLAAAAALVLMAGGGALFLVPRPAPEPTHTAKEALRNFMEIHALDFQGREACEAACTQWSKKRLGFSAPLPATCGDSSVVGGRACRVDNRPVAHFLLSDGRALYVFQEPIKGGKAQPGSALAVAGGLQARAWNEQGRGYVLVEPPAGK